MERVKGHRYLYRRGGSFVFRRVVPASARAAFSKTEVHVVLQARTLGEAVVAMQPHLSEFEVRLRSGAFGPASAASSAGAEPGRDEVEMRVRRWLAERMQRATAEMPQEEVEEVRALAELESYADDVRSSQKPGQRTLPLTTRWIVEALTEDANWNIVPGSQIHRHLIRTVARGQVEAARRTIEDIINEPRAVGDATFSADEYRLDVERAREQREPQETLMELFEGYVRERVPRPATVKAWRPRLNAFIDFLGHDQPQRVTPADVVRWKDHLVSKEGGGKALSAKTVNDGYLSMVRTVFGWGCDNDKVQSNPAAKVRVRAPKAVVLREKGLNDVEAQTILRACLTPAPAGMSPERVLARRWVPWLCAYTGARVNEITQLRAEDVFEVRGVPVLRITPEAGSTKDGRARLVAIHPHLIAQGFLGVVEGKRGPVFYDPARHRGGSDGNPQSKKVGEYLARWVRELGVTHPDVRPNHGWRHRFKTQARLHGMDSEIRDVIQGHSPRTVGETYGDTLPEVTLREISKLPAYQISVARRRVRGQGCHPPDQRSE